MIDIIDFLEREGWSSYENRFKKIVQHSGATVIVNGVKRIQEGPKICVEIEFTGSGYIEGDNGCLPLNFFDVNIDGDTKDSYAFNGFDEFLDLYKKIFIK